MACVKISLSLEASVVDLLRARAAEEGKPLSRYLAALVQADQQRREDALAAQGYRELARDSEEFSRQATGLAAEVWPEE